MGKPSGGRKTPAHVVVADSNRQEQRWGGGRDWVASALGAAGAPSTELASSRARTRGKTTEPGGGLGFSLLLEGEKEMGVRTPGLGGGMQAAPAGTRWGTAGESWSRLWSFSRQGTAMLAGEGAG